jgi:hypothetical protein
MGNVQSNRAGHVGGSTISLSVRGEHAVGGEELRSQRSNRLKPLLTCWRGVERRNVWIAANEEARPRSASKNQRHDEGGTHKQEVASLPPTSNREMNDV